MNRRPAGTHVSLRFLRWLWTLAVLGCLAFALGAAFQPHRLWPNLLLLGFLSVGFGLGGLLLIAFHNLTGARWDQSLHGVREAMAATLPWAAIFMAVVLLAGFASYPWPRAATLAEETDWFKRWWLEPGFFLARAIAYLAVWAVFAVVIVRASRRGAVQGSPTLAGVRFSAAFLVVFSLTFWLASADWIMSLEPSWYSTIFGVYNFGGVLLSAQAAITLLAIGLRRTQPLRGAITRDLLHDLGTLLLSYSCLWMYFWFCQYMLIWYTNMPEETSHYASRIRGLWAPLFYANIVINWAIPFAVLLPRAAKENAGLLGRIAILVLVGRWLDVYLMILPSISGGAPIIGFCEIGSMALVVGALGLLFLPTLRNSSRLSPMEPSCHVDDRPVIAEARR
jgi:hypothetical protein